MEINKVFALFDKDGSGFINSKDLQGVFNLSFNPKVASGELTEDEAFLEFLSSFGDKNNDGTITK